MRQFARNIQPGDRLIPGTVKHVWIEPWPHRITIYFEFQEHNGRYCSKQWRRLHCLPAIRGGLS